MEAALKPAAPSAVTVVITSCNQGALIREAVESALAQTIRPDCVIVVDDGSDDPASIAVLDGLAELGAPGRDGTAPAGQFAPVLEKSSLYQFPSCPPHIMILVTTTPSVDGYVINSYQGIVFGEVISGVNMFKDIGAGLRNMFGGRSQGYEEELMKARNEAILEMQQRAEAMGAHAVVGVDIDYEVLGADNGMLMVTASGTAVQLARRG